MSFRIINGRQIELLDEPDFFGEAYPWFEPKPVSPKRNINNNVLFADNSGNIHKHVIPSILGKRKIADAFGSGMHDKERYGQEIEPEFFKNNIGHGVYINPILSSSKNISSTQETEIIDWCYKYLASKKM
jgi:hypothetical protein